MTTTTAPILRQRLQLALLNRHQKQKSLLQKGFTLVELMIVIVIVGVLSAIALPNFLSQSSKAKLTEAQQKVSAGLKQAQISYVEKGTYAGLTCADVGLSASENGWDYTCTPNGTTDMVIKATGTAAGANANLGTGDWKITGSTGVITKGTADTNAAN